MLGKTKWLLATSLVASMAFVVPVEAASKKAPSAKAPTNQELLQRIEKLEQQLQDSKDSSKSVRARVTTLEQRADDVQIDFKDSRPTFKTGDGRFTLAIRARVQADYASYMQSDDRPGKKQAGFAPFDLASGTLIRRAYLGVEGKAFKDFWYEFRLNFGGGNGSETSDSTINLARIAYLGIPHFRINAGVIQPIFTYGDTVSSGQLTFIERAEIDNIAVGNFGGSDSRKGVELTFQKDGMFYGGDNLIVSAAYTGTTTGKASTTAANNFSATPEGHGNGGDEQSQVLARMAYRVFSNENAAFQIGGSGARVLSTTGLGNTAGGNFSFSDRPEIRVDGTSLVSATATSFANLNSATMWGVDAEAQYKNFYLGGEYHKYEIESKVANANNPHFSGWYVEGSWILTGERKEYSKSSNGNEMGSWGAPKVVTPFSLAGHSWGVWEVAARYSQVDLNFNPGLASGIAGGQQNIATLGVNWYLNNNIKLQLNDLVVHVERQSAAGTLNNWQGQNMNVIAARLQFAM